MDYSPEAVERIVGVSAKRDPPSYAHLCSRKTATIMWGMGVTQFGQAVDVVERASEFSVIDG